jgi:hypothetical protein
MYGVTPSLISINIKIKQKGIMNYPKRDSWPIHVQCICTKESHSYEDGDGGRKGKSSDTETELISNCLSGLLSFFYIGTYICIF